jgi:nitroreductase
MHRPAQTEYPVHESIQKRWSPRAFADKPIGADTLRSLFEAARWAASSSNEQPWAFLVATKDDKAGYEKLLSTLVEFNQGWAKSAPVLGIAVSHLNFAKNGNPNRNAFYDTGAAMAHLTAEATHRDLFVHQMGGFDAKKAKEIYAIPQDWEPIAAFAIGHGGDPQTLPDVLRERELSPRVRKPISEFVMSGEWGNVAGFAKKS